MNILTISIQGGLMIMAALLLRRVGMHRLPKTMFLILWGIILLRLLIPVTVSSRFSVYNVTGEIYRQTMESTHRPDYYAVHRFGEIYRQMMESTAEPVVPEEMPDIKVYTPAQMVPTVSSYPESWPPLFGLIWGSGAAAVFLFFAFVYINNYRELRFALPVETDEFLDAWYQEHPLIRPLRIMESDRIFTPMAAGLFRPRILLPKGIDRNDHQLMAYILEHEYIHIRRFDMLWKLLLTGAVCLHWFNPLVWLMSRLANRDLEITCDEQVVRHFGSDAKKGYACSLISMAGQKSRFISIYHGFSKNAAEERIRAIMKYKKKTAAAVVAAVVLLLGITAAFATSAAAGEENEEAASVLNFTDEEYAMLHTLRFDDYEDMTVARYQNRVWEMTDTPEFNELLERFYHDEELHQMRNRDETASYLHHVLTPLTAENWQERYFSEYAMPTMETNGEAAMLEYTITCQIIDPELLTVREYEQVRQDVVNGIQTFINERSLAELEDGEAMEEMIRSLAEELEITCSSDLLKISLDYSYLPFEPYQESDVVSRSALEEEMFVPATAADYQELLELKTGNYRSRSIADFNLALLEWNNADYDRMERIGGQAYSGPFPLDLTAEEVFFVSWTVRASNAEIAELVRSNYTDEPRKNPVLSFELVEDREDSWAALSFGIEYQISDEQTVQVGTRDQTLAQVVNGMQTEWEARSLDELVNMSASDMRQLLEALIEIYSNDQVALTIAELYYEAHSEPAMETN